MCLLSCFGLLTNWGNDLIMAKKATLNPRIFLKTVPVILFFICLLHLIHEALKSIMIVRNGRSTVISCCQSKMTVTLVTAQYRAFSWAQPICIPYRNWSHLQDQVDLTWFIDWPLAIWWHLVDGDAGLTESTVIGNAKHLLRVIQNLGLDAYNGGRNVARWGGPRQTSMNIVIKDSEGEIGTKGSEHQCPEASILVGQNNGRYLVDVVLVPFGLKSTIVVISRLDQGTYQIDVGSFLPWLVES